MDSQRPPGSNRMIGRALGKLKMLKMWSVAGTTSTKLIGSDSPLPFELVVEIFSLLVVSDLLRCRLVCRQFKLVVDSTPELQYNIELVASCCRDNPANKGLNVLQRLRLLRNSQAFWKKPRFKPGQMIPLEPINHYYHGNVFIMYKRTDNLEDTRLWDALDCIALESDDQAATVDRWSLTFDFVFESYAVDAGRGLLVLLHWRLRTVHAHGDWTFKIHIVSLQGGSAELNEVIEVQAPRRDFEECPALDIQGDMIAILVGGLYGAVSDQNRSLRIVIVNRETGLVYARLTRRCEYGLEYNSKSFIFASPTTFLLAVKCDGYFAVEVYTIADHDAQLDIIEPTLVAIYQFPPLQKGYSSAGSWTTFGKAYCGSIARKLDPRPFAPNPETTIVYVNRLYYGPSAGDTVRLNTFVLLSTFLSSVEHYRQRKTQGDGSPIFLPWSVWGPTSARCFNDTALQAVHVAPVAEYGSRVFQDGGTILDFNQPGIMRDLTIHGVSTRPTSLPKPKPKLSVSRAALQGFTRNTAMKDVVIPGTTGRIVRRPTVIPAGDIFVDDVVTMLPYRETRITWAEREPRVIFGGEIWAAGFPRRQYYDEPGDTALIYRTLVPVS